MMWEEVILMAGQHVVTQLTSAL